MSDYDPWLGYTPLPNHGAASMKRLWNDHGLPAPENDFSQWSAEYAREVWEAIRDFTDPDNELSRDDLLEFLDKLDVWDTDVSLQRWAPKQ